MEFQVPLPGPDSDSLVVPGLIVLYLISRRFIESPPATSWSIQNSVSLDETKLIQPQTGSSDSVAVHTSTVELYISLL